jgi:ribose 5-phosphate isomerase RpiB
LHIDSSGYGWRVGLNKNPEVQAYVLWDDSDSDHLIKWNDLRVVYLAIESFLP